MGFDSTTPPAFVGVALTGGGSRAANFSIAVLQELNEMGILEHVDALSTVSGGSLAGAFYALHSRNVDWKEARRLMAIDFIEAWKRKIFQPDQLVSQFFGSTTRTDLMTEVFDDTIFHHATFSDLDAENVKGPKLFINASDLTGSGARFVFDERTFRSDIRSNLKTLPVSVAVMASAAFPAVFNSVALEEYPELRSHDESERSSTANSARRFHHLMDGGSFDNLGVTTLTEAAFAHFFWNQGDDETPRSVGPCLMILVDAYHPPDNRSLLWKADRRAAIDRLVDTDFFDSIDILLGERRLETLGRLGLREVDTSPAIRVRFIQGLGRDYLTAYRRVSRFSVPYECSGTDCSLIPRAVGFSPSSLRFTCSVWHISLADVRSVSGFDNEGAFSEVSEDRLDANGRLGRIVEKIPTDFRLRGPQGCKSEFIQQAIYDAASVLVRDPVSASSVCRWMSDNKSSDLERCLAPSREGAPLRAYELVGTSFEKDTPATLEPEALSIRCP